MIPENIFIVFQLKPPVNYQFTSYVQAAKPQYSYIRNIVFYQ